LVNGASHPGSFAVTNTCLEIPCTEKCGIIGQKLLMGEPVVPIADISPVMSASRQPEGITRYRSIYRSVLVRNRISAKRNWKFRANRRQPVGSCSPPYRVFALRDISRGLPLFASRHFRSLLSGTVWIVRVQISTVIARLSGDT
jgi:hypothetical protein